jgi:signal transduction histidine kinase
VVLNLITNARDAMKPLGGTLTIGLCERRGWLELSVSDTGSGIPEEIRDKIFEPFVTTKGALGGSQTPGTGLGLSVSYGIVQEHGGTITVESVTGRGTTLTVRLPIVGVDMEHEIAIGQY